MVGQAVHRVVPAAPIMSSVPSIGLNLRVAPPRDPYAGIPYAQLPRAERLRLSKEGPFDELIAFESSESESEESDTDAELSASLSFSSSVSALQFVHTSDRSASQSRGAPSNGTMDFASRSSSSATEPMQHAQRNTPPDMQQGEALEQDHDHAMLTVPATDSSITPHRSTLQQSGSAHRQRNSVSLSPSSSTSMYDDSTEEEHVARTLLFPPVMATSTKPLPSRSPSQPQPSVTKQLSDLSVHNVQDHAQLSANPRVMSSCVPTTAAVSRSTVSRAYSQPTMRAAPQLDLTASGLPPGIVPDPDSYNSIIVKRCTNPHSKYQLHPYLPQHLTRVFKALKPGESTNFFRDADTLEPIILPCSCGFVICHYEVLCDCGDENTCVLPRVMHDGSLTNGSSV